MRENLLLLEAHIFFVAVRNFGVLVCQSVDPQFNAKL